MSDIYFLENARKDIMDYNKDSDVQKLKYAYSRPSFFEMLSKDRSETVHSAFIRWLLQGDDIAVSPHYSPIMMFLDLLIRRDDNQYQYKKEKKRLIDENFSNAILTRSVSLTNLHATTEYPVKKLAEDKLNRINNSKERNDFNNNINGVKDRIDVLIECDLKGIPGFDSLQIIIENKVESVEGGPKNCKMSEKGGSNDCQKDDKYKNMTQTERYYYAAKLDKGSKKMQIFVYLTPLSTLELDDYENLDDALKCTEKDHYIQINYQDILDYIMIPLLNSDNISDRVRVLLEEYKSTLTIPSIVESDDEKSIQKLLVMASQDNERKILSDYLTKYKQLIKASICVANRSVILQGDEKSYCQWLMEEFLNSQNNSDFNKNKKGWPDFTGKKIKSKSFEDFCKEIKASDILLLLEFYKQNYRLMIAAIKILVDTTSENDDSISSDDFSEWQDIYTQLSSGTQDTSKYRLEINGDTIGEKYNKRELVRQLVQNIELTGNLIQSMNQDIVGKMFLHEKPKDITRYDGLRKKDDNENSRYVLEKLTQKNSNQFSLYVSNQWGILPLPDSKKNDTVNYPSGWGGNFGKFLDFFEKNQNYNVKIERVGDETNSSDNTSPDNTVTEER